MTWQSTDKSHSLAFCSPCAMVSELSVICLTAHIIFTGCYSWGILVSHENFFTAMPDIRGLIHHSHDLPLWNIAHLSQLLKSLWKIYYLWSLVSDLKVFIESLLLIIWYRYIKYYSYFNLMSWKVLHLTWPFI